MLLPPTAITLRELAAEPDVAAMLAARRRIVPRRPVITFTGDQAWLTIPDDVPATPARRPDPQPPWTAPPRPSGSSDDD